MHVTSWASNVILVALRKKHSRSIANGLKYLKGIEAYFENDNVVTCLREEMEAPMCRMRL